MARQAKMTGGLAAQEVEDSIKSAAATLAQAGESAFEFNARIRQAMLVSGLNLDEACEDRAASGGELRWLTDAYMALQKQRVAAGNRLAAIQRGADRTGDAETATMLHEGLHLLEKRVFERMENALTTHPAWPWLSRVKGIGPTLATKLLGLIGDISSFDTVSKLWRVAGLAVINGQRERLVKGEKAHYSSRLKTTMYLVGTSFLKASSPYRAVYDEAREHYERTHPEWTDGHRHLAAMRKMEKLFLSHLWEMWRRAEGLPVRGPYVEEYMGHTTMRKPEEFVD